MNNLCDAAAERAVLAGVCTYGADGYADVADLVTAKSFSVDSNRSVWACLEYVFKENPKAQVDLPTILSAAQAVGLGGTFDPPAERDHLRAIMNMAVKKENVRSLARQVRKLEFARHALEVVDAVRDDLLTVTGTEPIEAILSRVENPVLDISSLLTGSGQGPRSMGDGVREYVGHLAANQRDVVGIPSGFRKYDQAIGGGFRPGTVNCIGARPKVGKAQPLDSTVHTPAGPRRMGDIVVGNLVCTPTGISAVESVHPQGKVDIYRVTFADGDSVECCLDHLWEVSRKRHGHAVLPLKKIVEAGLYEPDGRHKWAVRLPVVCCREFQPVPIDPYLLGVLIGDGSLRHTVQLTSADKELVDGLGHNVEQPYRWKKTPSNKYGYCLTRGKGYHGHKYKEVLKQLGLFGLTSHDKFIPSVYLNNNEQVRRAMLQGLLDTDGSVDERGNIDFSTTSTLLAQNMKDLAQSLGGLCRIKSRVTTCNGKSFLSYRLAIKFADATECFRLSRKRARCKVRSKGQLARRIASVDFVGRKEAQCIKLTSEDGLYLTDHYVVTHNTLLAMNMGVRVASGAGYDWPKFDPVAQVPVLYLDTEMTREDQWTRMLSLLSGVKIDDIETGRYAKDPYKRRLVSDAVSKLETIPYDFLSVAGQPFEETEAVMRRWVTRRVGTHDDGSAKPCLIIFDYLKLMSSEAMEAKPNWPSSRCSGS
jgi:replicative DNA helicase